VEREDVIRPFVDYIYNYKFSNLIFIYISLKSRGRGVLGFWGCSALGAEKQLLDVDMAQALG
jgi:hypothetical protein